MIASTEPSTMRPRSSVQPLMFGPAEAQLYGCFHAPGGDTASETAVLMCQPIGYELIRSHKCMRILATRLAAAGCAVLRFDYLGCGDSAGDFEDASIPAWLASIRLAAAQLRKLAPGSKLAIVGLRLGATLSAMAISQRLVQAQRLVLWEPVIRGQDLITHMKEDHQRHVQRVDREFGAVPADAASELLGYRWPAQLLNEVSRIDLTSLAAWDSAVRTLLVDNSSNQAIQPLVQLLRGIGADVEAAAQPESAAWDVEPHMAALPHASIQRIVQRLGEEHP